MNKTGTVIRGREYVNDTNDQTTIVEKLVTGEQPLDSVLASCTARAPYSEARPHRTRFVCLGVSLSPRVRLGVHNYHFQSRGNQGSEGLQGLLQLVLPLCESRNRRAQFMYLIMQALELRLQLLAERLNCATKGPLATGISSTMPPDKLCLRTAASWARSRKSLLYSLFYGRVRQPLDFFTSRACLMRCLLIASKIVNRRTCKK